MMFATKPILIFFLCMSLGLISSFPVTTYANCEGISGPAHFSLYKNRQANFYSSTNADYEQKYDIKWFVGSKHMGSVTKSGGESYTLKGSKFSSQTFSITGFHKNNNQWLTSHHKIFPDPDGGIQVRFEDGACDNSFESSPDLKVIINID